VLLRPLHVQKRFLAVPFPDRLLATAPFMMPRIIHQTWKTEAIPPQWQAAQRSWRDAHPEWEYRFWTDEDLDRLVRERAHGEDAGIRWRWLTAAVLLVVLASVLLL
jgi:hypothetical protein